MSGQLKITCTRCGVVSIVDYDFGVERAKTGESIFFPNGHKGTPDLGVTKAIKVRVAVDAKKPKRRK